MGIDLKDDDDMELFPHNCYDMNIVNQPEIEYRVAKYPFRVRHRYTDRDTEEQKYWDVTYCPVCFWNTEVDFWDSLIDRGTKFCKNCGQKIQWEENEDGT